MKPNTLALTVCLLGTWQLTGCNSDDIEELRYSGYWLSEIYGEAVLINEGNIKTYQFTEHHCNKVVDRPFEEVSKYYEEGDNTLTHYNYPNLPNEEKQHYRREYKRSELPMPCRSIDAKLPPTAEPLPAPTQLDDLDFFVETFDQHYYDFNKTDADWNTLVAVARNSLSDDSTNDEFFTVLNQLIMPLQNGHVGISNNGKSASYKNAEKPTIYTRLNNEFLAEQQISPPLTQEQNSAMNSYSSDQLQKIKDIIGSYLAPNVIPFAANYNIVYGTFANDNIGYINVLSFNDYTDNAVEPAPMLSVLDGTIESALTKIQDTEGLVIDLRFNGGGFPFLATGLTQHFTGQEQLGFISSVRYGDQFTPEEEFFIEPKAPIYEKPIVVLISNTTASAAEKAAIILREFPHVTLIGESTQGMLSGYFPRTLNNGIHYSLSNTRLLSATREDFEKIGIPPDIETSFSLKEDREKGIDKGIDAALEWLRE